MPLPLLALGATQTAAGMLLPAIIPLFKATAEKIKDKYDEYGKTELAEMEAVRAAYKKHVQPEESKALKKSGFTTLKAKANSEDNNENEFPIFLQMDPKKPKIPLLLSANFRPEKDFTEWTYWVADSELRPYIEDILGYICHYQTDRDKRWWKGKGYNCDPTTMVFEEIKYMLLEMARAPMNEETLQIVEARIRYLKEITDKNIFKAGDHTPTRQETILYVTDILEKVIKPLIVAFIDRTSAREHFYTIKVQISLAIKNSITFLFYAFRDSADIPENFILEQIRQPSLALYKNILDNTSGRLLQYLLNTPSLQLVFPPANLRADRSEFTYETIMLNEFINAEGNPQYPLIKTNHDINIHRYNWYQENSGILFHFQSSKDTVDTFLKVHGNIQKLAIFYLICDLLYELAGDGGNLLVYGLAHGRVEKVIRAYRELMEKIDGEINHLFSVAKQLHDDIGKNKTKRTKDITQWDSYYHLISNAKTNFDKNIKKIEETLNQIKKNITKVNQPEYLDQVKQRLQSFIELTNYFTSETNQKEEIEDKKPSNALAFDFFSALDVPITDKKALEQASIDPTQAILQADDFIKQRDYKAAIVIFDQLLTIHPRIDATTDILFKRADCCVLVGAYEQAIADLTVLIDLFKCDNYEIFYLRAKAYMGGNYLKQALTDINTALQKQPENSQALALYQDLVKIMQPSLQESNNGRSTKR